jgi:fatty-acid desaturase
MRNPVWRIVSDGADASAGSVVWAPGKSLWNTAMFGLAIWLGPRYFSGSGLAVFLGLSYVTLLFGHSLGMHRRLIHRSFECPKPVERLLVWLGVLVGMAGPFGILKIHDLRDWAQREPRCHDFFAHRRGLWLDAFWQLHCQFRFGRSPQFRIESEIATDRWYQFMELTWPLHQVLLAAILYWIGGVSWAVWGVAVRVAVSVTSHWIVTYFAHNPGPGLWLVKNAAVQASNLSGWGFLTHGECWHNNHHAFPESARMGLQPGESDPGYAVLRILQRYGLVGKIALPRSQDLREDLERRSVLEATFAQTRRSHRMCATDPASVISGRVVYSPIKSVWFTAMAFAALVGGALTFTWAAFALYVGATAAVLLLGHSLGSHRKLIHDSYQCPKWLEYFLVYCGAQVGLAGPIGLLRQHELRDFAQRERDCHPYLRHGQSFWMDGWWQLHCELRLANPPTLTLEPRIADDRFYRVLERTWMLQQLPPAVLLFAVGGWGFVFWGVCARITSGVLGHWLIGHFAHNRGGRHWDVRGAAVQGHNIPFTSLLTMGESWHNNHHAFPGSARLGLFAGEWDPGWWMLLVLHKVGLAWRITLPRNLPARAELQAIDAAAAEPLRYAAEPSLMPHARVGLRQVAQLCLAAPTAHNGGAFLLEGPAAILSARLTRKIISAKTTFASDASLKRLSLAIDSIKVTGLPALCIALARRGTAGVVFALLAAPLAVVFENLRESFDVV